MAIPKNITAQRDFSAGEVDPELKRSEDLPEYKAGLRQASNWRILNTRKVKNRSGRRALFVSTSASSRVEEFEIAPGVKYKLQLTGVSVTIYDATDTSVFGVALLNYDATKAVWTILGNSIYLCYLQAAPPLVLTWDGVVTWTATNYAVTLTAGNQFRSAFYRISPKGITMLPAAQTGNAVAVTFSAGMNLVAGMIGTRMRFINREIEINTVTSPTTGTINIIESLPGSQVLTFPVGIDVSKYYALSDVVEGSVSNTTGIITNVNVGARQITVQLLSVVTTLSPATSVGVSGSIAFTTADVVAGPGGGLNPSAVGAIGNPQAVTYWDEDVMNNFRGWAGACFVDQSRLGFCDLKSVPRGIIWSAFDAPTDLYPGANPGNAFFELVPNQSRVFYVVPGMDGSEFVFCTNRLYYIPINTQNPLKPGSVQFSTVSEDECGQVEPRRAGEFILYSTGGLNQLKAIKIYGAYTRAYKTEALTETSAHLFTSIRSIAIMTASASFAERYVFVLNQDHSIAVGKYTVDKNDQLEGAMGWTPWLGVGAPIWVSCHGSNILFTTNYPGAALIEQLDDNRYLDASQLYNTQPSGLPIPGGKGPLWWQAGQTVNLLDGPLGTRDMGQYQVDANGFLIPQLHDGEDFTSVYLICGQAWTATMEPFVPAAQPGQSAQQRMRKRRIARADITVKDSTGFTFARLKSGKTIPGGASLGTILNTTVIPAWQQGEIVTNPPPLREQTYSFRPLGRDNDPRVCIIKTTPGPITVEEFGLETSI